MKKTTLQITMILIALLCSFTNSFSQANQEDKTLSPYFFVNSEGEETDVLPLQSTSADVNIAGVMADVTVTQLYRNEGSNTLEAIYIFPTSTKAAVYGMTMKVGDRVIDAEIRERGKARKEYQKAKSEGKRASLLEQERPNVFQMNVANIQPGDLIEVELKYTELLVPTEGEYEFIYPAVVGPRYPGELKEATDKDDFVSTPYQKAGKKALFNFDVRVNLSAGMPIQDVTSSSHHVDIDYNDVSTAGINLNPSESNPGNRDFILNYRLSGSQIESGLLLYEHEDENHFLLMVQPPKTVKADEIPPREYIFIVDVSGSMRGFPIDVSKKLLRNLIAGLKPTDKFNVLFFASSSKVLAEESLHATSENVNEAVSFMDNQKGGGGTNMLSALKGALALPRCEEDLSRSVVIITDGYVSVEEDAFELIRNNLDAANMFAFGIGSSVNRHLIEGIAHVGMGEPFIITSKTEAGETAEKFRQYINSPVLTQVKAKYKGFDAYDIEPITVPDVLAERPIIIYGKYKGEAKGSISIKGYAGKSPYKKTFDVTEVQSNNKNAAIRYLWARERIRTLGEYNKLAKTDDRVKKITALGLKYNLMTAYTSFIAIDHEKIAELAGVEKQVNQPVPMPAGVSNSAVGFDLSIENVVRKSSKSNIAKASVSIGAIKTNVDATTLSSLKVQFEKQVKTMNNCLGKYKAKQNLAITLILTIDAAGKIIKVDIRESTINQESKRCIIEKLQGFQLSGLSLSETISCEVPVSFVF